MKISNVVVISDTHSGCKLALCPDLVKLDETDKKSGYKSSKLQKVLMLWWDEFWTKWVPKVTKHEPYIIVHNGDALDGVHHNSTTQITHNLTFQTNIAYEILKDPIGADKCVGYYQIRGTEAHVGKSAQEEESLMRRLAREFTSKITEDENGNYSRWELWMDLNGCLIHFSHHVGTTSSASYESTAVFKELVEAYNEAGRWKRKPPDVVVRSHRHRSIEIRVPSQNTHGIAFVTPSWQLKTPFSHRIALGRASTPQIGGYLIRTGDEDRIYTRDKIWSIGRPKEVVI